MAESKGIRRYLELLLDRERANRTQREAQDAINKGTDPKKGQQNLSHLDRAFEGIGRTALKLGGILAGVFALGRIKDFGVSAVKEFAEAEAVWSRLGVTLGNVGVELSGVRGEIDRVVASMERTSTMGDEDVASTLQTLVQLSGDYAGSLKQIQLVADLATGAEMSFEQASELVGKALAGNTELLVRQFPALKNSKDILGDLSALMAGQAAKAAGTLQGQVTRLGNAWSDFKEEVGKAISEAGGGTSVIETLTGAVRGLTQWLADHGEEVDKFAIALEKVAIGAEKAAAAIPKLWNVINAQPLYDKFGMRSPGNKFLDWLTAPGTPTLPPAQVGPPASRANRIPGITITAPRIAPVAAAASGQAAAEETVKAFWATLAIMQPQALPDGGALSLDKVIPPPTAFDEFIDTLGRVQGVAESVASSMSDAFGRAFDQIGLRERAQADLTARYKEKLANATTDNQKTQLREWYDAEMKATQDIAGFYEMLGRSVTGSMLAGLSEYAAGQAARHFAEAVGAAAYALGFTSHGNFASAAAAAGAAAQHAAAGLAFSALAGAAASGGNRSAGGGGGTSSRTDTAGRGIDKATPRGPEIHIYIDPLDPSKPAWQRTVAETMQYATERYGPNGKITVHPAGASR